MCTIPPAFYVSLRCASGLILMNISDEAKLPWADDLTPASLLFDAGKSYFEYGDVSFDCELVSWGICGKEAEQDCVVLWSLHV